MPVKKIKFNKTNISEIQPDSNKRLEFQDTNIDGFRLYVTPKGVKTFY